MTCSAARPELNVPRNLVEYWGTDDLAPFIRIARDYHARSKMPGFADWLTDAEIGNARRSLTAVHMIVYPGEGPVTDRR